MVGRYRQFRGAYRLQQPGQFLRFVAEFSANLASIRNPPARKAKGPRGAQRDARETRAQHLAMFLTGIPQRGMW